MTDYDNIESIILALKQCKEMEHAIDRCKRGVTNKGIVYRIAAESDYGVLQGGADRDINIVLTVEESAKIFQLVEEMLSLRLAETKTKLPTA